MRILPAGVPQGLSRFGQRFRAAAANTPLFFIGAVIAIAVVFRIGIGAVKPAAAADEVPETKSVPARVGKVTLPSTMAVASVTPSATPAATAAAAARPASAAGATVGRDPAESAPRPMVRGKKPRTHGKR